jgi:hypothetical protein
VVDSAEPREDTGVQWFGVPARRLIIAVVALYAAGTIAMRAVQEKDPLADSQEVVGEPYSEFYNYFGPPERQEPDGRGGTVMRYEKCIVTDNRFALIPFDLYVDANMRIYRLDFKSP